MSYQLALLQTLGFGGHADVHLAQRTDNAERVAVKILRDHARPDERKAFLREARILGLRVPGLIPLLDSNMQAERPFYVMPLMGGTLTPWASRLNDAQLRSVATHLARTLAALHATGDAHGDIKPDNILIAYSGQLHLADPLGNGAHCTVWFAENRGGTPGYWAPEVRANGPISAAADVYSYGVTLYEMLTGKRPIEDQQFDPTSEGYTRSPMIRHLIEICCQANPKARPTMQEVLRVLGGEPWANILLKRKQAQMLLVLGCIALIALLVSLRK